MGSLRGPGSAIDESHGVIGEFGELEGLDVKNYRLVGGGRNFIAPDGQSSGCLEVKMYQPRISATRIGFGLLLLD